MIMMRILLAMTSLLIVNLVNAQVPEDSPRMTPLVKLIQRVEPAVVSLFIASEDGRELRSGSGTLIHPAGFALTNHHVVTGDHGFAVLQSNPVRFRVIARLPEKDLALIQLHDHRGDLPMLPLGRNSDLMNGESVAVVGNPGGRGIVVTSGIISAKSTIVNAANALWASQHETKWRDDFVQFDAASNRGNSGGALINMEGELIGIVSGFFRDEQNASFAIPIDRVRNLFAAMLEPELIHNRFVGVALDPSADRAIVTDVMADSPADQAGIEVGDQITSVFKDDLNTAADWWLGLYQHLPNNKQLPIVIKRDEKELKRSIETSEFPSLKAVSADSLKASLKTGLSFKLFHGEFKVLPEFEGLNAVQNGVSVDLDLTGIRGDREDHFATQIEGYLRLEKSGVYRVNLESDDGSRLFLHGELFIDHDGNHPPMVASRLMRAEAGLHPIRIEYFEVAGGQVLELNLQRLDSKDRETIMPIFHHANAGSIDLGS